MGCPKQEKKVKEIISLKIEEIISKLSNKSYEEAKDLAKRYNKEIFFRNNLIQVRQSTYSREDGIPEVSFNENLLEKVIKDKVENDTYLETQERIQELKNGNNFEFDDTPSVTTYNEFNYASVISNKLLLKEDLTEQRDLLKNKDVHTKEQLKQIEYLNEIIRRLYIDISKLQKGEETLDFYLNSFNKDIENVKELLKHPTMENLQNIDRYLKVIETFTKKDGFLKEAMSEIEDESIVNKLRNLEGDISNIKDDVNTKIVDKMKNLILFHLEQKEEYKNWEKEELQKEVDRLYTNQLEESLGKISKLKANVSMLDKDEEKNIILSVVYKNYTDALARNNNKEKRQALSNMKEDVEKELEKLGYTVGKGFNKKADQSVFLRKSPNTYQLIGKFSTAWVNKKKKFQKELKEISSFLYKGDKTPTEESKIIKNFKNLKDNVDFIDTTRLPEILEDSEFSEYSSSFMDKTEADNYKKELINKVGEREYNKIVEEQKQKIRSYEIFKSVREARLRGKYNIAENEDLQKNIPESVWNTHLHFLYSKSPFIFSENFRTKGTNIITKPYYIKGQKFLSENTFADMEFISYLPKKEEFFDNEFTTIENNSVLKNAWDLMADLVEYNNKNGFNKKPYSLTEYSLASQDVAKNFPQRLLGLLSKDTLKTIHSALTTTRYKNPDSKHNISGQISNIDQEIERLAQAMLIGNDNTEEDIYEAQIKAKEIIMKRQNNDIMENILASTEMVEVFKAKREIEDKINFIKKHFDNVTDRENYKELLTFFRDKELYQINNRANFNILGKAFNFSDMNGMAWTRFYNAKETEIRNATKESLKYLKEQLKSTTNAETISEIKSEISALENFLDSGGKVLTPGSIIEAIIIKASRVAAFSLNVSAQITNKVIGSVNAWEVDGKLGFWEAGVYHDALSFSRKWKSALGNKTIKKEIKVGELLLQRLQIFQNSSNEIFKLKKSRAASTFDAILENPMNFVSEVEKTIQRPQIFALLSDITIKDKDGKEVKMFDPKNRNFPAFDISEEGDLILKDNFKTKNNIDTFINNNSQEYANLFGDSGKIPNAIAYINGDYRETSTYLFEKNMIPAILMLFKRWTVETFRKKYNVLNRLGKNDHKESAIAAIALKGGVYSLSSGALFGPLGLGASLAMYTSYHGYKKIKKSLDNDKSIMEQAYKFLLQARVRPVLKGFDQGVRLSIMASAQALSMIIDPLTKKQYITSDHLKRLIKIKEVKENGEEFTQKEINEIKEDLYFLTTSAAATIKFLMMRYLIMLALYPNGDDEEKYKDRVKKGDNFWERVTSDPATASYYALENMFSGFVDDSNLLLNLKGLERMGDMQTSGFFRYVDDVEKIIDGEGKLQFGPNKGENRLWAHIQQSFIPAMFKGGLSFGFDSKTKRDYDMNNIIDQIKVPEIEKINKARLKARKKEKLVLEEKYKKLPESTRKTLINKTLNSKYKVLKKEHFLKNGKLKPVFKDMVKSYYKK